MKSLFFLPYRLFGFGFVTVGKKKSERIQAKNGVEPPVYCCTPKTRRKFQRHRTGRRKFPACYRFSTTTIGDRLSHYELNLVLLEKPVAALWKIVMLMMKMKQKNSLPPQCWMILAKWIQIMKNRISRKKYRIQ